MHTNRNTERMRKTTGSSKKRSPPVSGGNEPVMVHRGKQRKGVNGNLKSGINSRKENQKNNSTVPAVISTAATTSPGLMEGHLVEKCVEEVGENGTTNLLMEEEGVEGTGGLTKEALEEIKRQSELVKVSQLTDSATSSPSIETKWKLNAAERDLLKLCVKRKLFKHTKMIYNEEQLELTGKVSYLIFCEFKINNLSVAEKDAWWTSEKKRLVRVELNLKRNNVCNQMKDKFWGTYCLTNIMVFECELTSPWMQK